MGHRSTGAGCARHRGIGAECGLCIAAGYGCCVGPGRASYVPDAFVATHAAEHTALDKSCAAGANGCQWRGWCRRPLGATVATEHSIQHEHAAALACIAGLAPRGLCWPPGHRIMSHARAWGCALTMGQHTAQQRWEPGHARLPCTRLRWLPCHSEVGNRGTAGVRITHHEKVLCDLHTDNRSSGPDTGQGRGGVQAGEGLMCGAQAGEGLMCVQVLLQGSS